MKNLKKVLALVVAVAMIASMGLVASAASYSDVAANAKYADAVNLLSNLGIITGFEDGTFRPNETVTRAQAATMIVRMLGLADGVEKGATQFTDVTAENWASGYVNVAVANGVVNGMGDGTFNPEGEVTYGQIVKMIVCALGYAPVAENNGGWANGGYIVAGSKAGFTKGVAGTADAAASRATVAQLIYNALEVELMDQTSYSTGIYGDQYTVLEGKTVLTEYLELEKIEGVVVETYLSNVDDFDMEGDKYVKLVVTKNEAEDAQFPVSEGEATEFVTEDANIASLLGYSVVAYVGETEDADNVIFAIAEKAGKNSALTLDAEDLIGFEDGVLSYWKNANKAIDVEIEAFVKVGKGVDAVEVETANQVVNGFNVYTDAEEIFGACDTGLCEEITLLDNDGDGEYEFVFATIPSANKAEFVVEEVEEVDNTFYVTGIEEETFDIDYEAETVLYTVVKDGKIVDASAIVEGDVITVLDTELSIVTVYVSSAVVEGVVEEENEDEVYTIAGKEYELSGLSEVEVAAGNEGKFYLNALGKIAYVDLTSDGAAADFVYVIDAHEDLGSFGDTEYLVKVVNANGEVEVLTVKEKKVSINGEKENEAGEKLAGEDLFNEVETALADGAFLAKIDTTAEGELSAIYFAESEFFAGEAFDAENDYEYNEARGRYNKVELTADMLVFHVDTEEEDVEEAITVTTVGKLFVDGETYTFDTYENEDEDVIVLVVYDAQTSVSAEAPVMVVTGVAKRTVDDEKTIKLTGIVAGKSVSVIVDPEEGYEETDAFVKGDIVLYAENDGLATDVEKLFVDGEAVPGTDMEADFTDDAVTVHYGEITEEGKKSFTLDDTDEFFYADEVNVTVVTLNMDGTVEVKAGSKSSVAASNTKYTRKAFVKTELESEDVVTDIVVFVEKVDAE